MLVAVGPNKFDVGVSSPEDDWRAVRGSPANCREHKKGVGVPADFTMTHLDRALHDAYRTDAHLVMYTMRDPRGVPLTKQPRVRKIGLPFIESLGYTVEISVLFADVDNPGHCDWTPELEKVAHAEESLLATAGVYYTAHGRRIVQPLSRAIPVAAAEGVLAGWLRSLEDLGLHPDWSCKDWTRHYRVPRATVSRRPLELRTFFDRMRPVDPPASAVARAARAHARRDRSYETTSAIDDAPIAKAFEDAGWLGPRLGPDKRAALCPWRDQHSAGRDFDSSTVLFAPSTMYPLGFWWCSHAHCASRTQADVVRALPAGARSRIPKEPSRPRPPRDLLSKESAKVRLEGAFRQAPDGLSVVIAGCGVGKTEAALQIAAERARSRGGARALHTKTAISVPTTRLALELANRAAALGVPVRRMFGPLALRNPDGSPVCRFHDTAAAFSSGGLSIPWEFCSGRGRQPCEHADSCEAHDGVAGDEDAKIIIGPHQLLGRLDGAAGATGLLVIDEPPALLTHEVITEEQLATTAVRLTKYFDGRYACALRVSLEALGRWIRTGPLDEPGTLARGVAFTSPELLDEAFEWTGETDAVGAARLAFPPPKEGEKPRPKSPPVKWHYVEISKGAIGAAKQIGEASRVAELVHLGLTAEPGQVVARLEERGRGRVLVLTLAEVQLREALRREGAVVVADAGGHYHLPIYERVVGYAAPVVEAHVVDGAEIDRWVYRTRATRKAWFLNGSLTIDTALARTLRKVVDWILDGHAERVAIVTFKSLAAAISTALCTISEDVPFKEVSPQSIVDTARKHLAPELARLPRLPDVGHYGAIRGLDHWKGHDVLVTLGDPWPQLTDVRWESEFLTLPNWEGRLEEWAAGELEQAHGRLRTVHRTSPARALHVGGLTPKGWHQPRELRDVGGRPSAAFTSAQMRDAIARAGGIRAAARTLGVDAQTVRRHAK